MSLIRKINDDLLNTHSLNRLSSKLHLIIAIILLLQNIPISIYRFFYFPMIVTYINILEVSIYTSAIILYFFNKLNLSIIFSALGLPILFSYFTFFNPIETTEETFVSSYWFLLCYVLIYSTLIRTNRIRILYIVFVFLIYFIPGSLSSFDYPGNIIKIIQFSTLILIPLIMSSYIEKQDIRIIKLNKALKQRLHEKDKLSQRVEEKNQELITFSHIMGHDLKTPIRTINSFTQLLRKKITFQDEKNEQYFQFIEDSSKSMKNLIDDLLTYYKIESEQNKTENIDIEDILNEIKSSYQFELNNEKVKIMYSELPKTMGYRNLLKTLFTNLISNGIKYQPKNEINHIPTIKISASEDDMFNSIIISDNGIGIDASYLDHLFDPFKRFHNDKEYQGTGLGMSICKRVMDKHGGDITVEKTSEQGTLIKLNFPKYFT